MSVINQMLKDLDKRQVNQQQNVSDVGKTPAPAKSSFSLIAIIILTVAITLTVVCFWQLQSENKTLKQQANQHAIANKSINESHAIAASIIVESKPFAKNSLVIPEKPQKNEKKPAVVEQNIKNIVDMAMKNNSDLSNIESEHKQQTVVETEKPELKPKTTLSISRRQLSPEMLSKQKMKKAEEAIANGKYSKAETLLEDVLLLVSSNEEARLQLAALWFGRHAYQPAINLLSQGIALSPKNIDFRLMQAKIYAKQGRYQVALNTLQEHTQTNDIEYLSLLANLSQQLADFDSAISTYLHLITLQANAGRWQLGLAISYDSNSQFTLAKSSYNKAIKLGDLSRKSSEFAKQRMTQLGE